MTNDRYSEAKGDDTSARSVAAQKAARTRRDNQARRDAEYRRSVFLVTNGDEPRKQYGPIWSTLLDEPIEVDLTAHFTLDDVIAEVVKLFDHPVEDDACEDQEPGLGGEDAAIWRDGRLLAVVRGGVDCKAEVTRFNSPERERVKNTTRDAR